MTLAVVRGRLLNPRPNGSVDFLPDGAILGNEQGRIVAVGAWQELAAQWQLSSAEHPPSPNWIVPPFLDAHIHIPQHPIRGQFLAGVEGNPPGGPLLAGLLRNVFPTEARCASEEWTREVVAAFARDTLAQGVIGGAAYMTVHASATRIALECLPASWQVGLVLMERNCPEDLRTDRPRLERDATELAQAFGKRLIITDRFAGAVDSDLRRQGVELAGRFDLRMQTHLNEQWGEKQWIEDLYPEAASYTDVYRRDGLLTRSPLLAHCIRMRPEEYDMVADAPGGAIVHCPVSNTLLGSGIMPLDAVRERNIPYSICTDVGASPTTSILCEMVQFLRVHQGRSRWGTPQEALFRATLAPAEILGLAAELGSFDVGKGFSFLEVTGAAVPVDASADEAIRVGLLGLSSSDLAAYGPTGEWGAVLDRLQREGLPVSTDLAGLTNDVQATARRMEGKVVRVVVEAREVFS